MRSVGYQEVNLASPMTNFVPMNDPLRGMAAGGKVQVNTRRLRIERA
jgi:hypothetical protein